MKKLLNNDIVNLIQSIKRFYKLHQEHKSNDLLDKFLETKQPKHVVFLVLDGLGYNLMAKTPFLKEHVFQKIDTVFPPTTACATISLQTGLYPCEHGWLGWTQYFKEWDDIIELFTGYGFYNRIKYPVEEINKNIAFNKYYNQIKNSKEIFPDFINGEATSFEHLLQLISNNINSNSTSFTYGYWTQPDKVLHQKGENHPETLETLLQIDELIKKYSKYDDTVFIVTADHGHIDSESILLINHPKILDCLKCLPSIEGRFTNFFLEEDKETDFIKETKFLLKYFDIYKKEDFKKTDFFNFANHHFIVDEFLGDYQFIAKDKYILEYDKVTFVSAHAGGTAQEMEVPLVIITK